MMMAESRNSARRLVALVGTRRGATVIGVALLASGSCLYILDAQRAKRQGAPRKAVAGNGGAEASSSGQHNKLAKPRRRGKGSSATLQILVRYLLSIAGKRIAVLFVLAIARTAISNRLARLQGHLFRAAFLRQVPLFMRNLIENVALCLLNAGLESTARRWLAFIELKWRDVLTKRIHRPYFENMVYYKLPYVDKVITNPEQRICEDVPKFTKGLAELVGEWVNAVIDAAFYSWQLKQYSQTNTYTLAILGYVIGAGGITSVLAPNFGRLFKRQQENEGAYRQMQARLRSNSESIAFYGGIDKEATLLKDKFREVLQHNGRLLVKQWQFGMVQDFFLKYLGATAAVVLIIGPFFSGHLRPTDNVQGRAHMLSNMRYHTSVVIYLFAALGTLGVSSRKLMKLSAYSDRISELEATVKDVGSGKTAHQLGGEEPTGVIESSEDEIAFENAVVVTPANATLVRDLTLRVPGGTNLLVTGPNGSGKSSLFRVLGGLWPLTKGRILKPGSSGGDGLSHEIFYVPQRPYVTVGTLQEQLIYPLQLTEHGVDIISSDRLRQLLWEVDLEYLADQEGGLTRRVNWSEVLSLGEQQRLGMARLFYHKPKFAILDECTSGVTVDMEERFCSKVKELGCTCVTISHRPALVAFHDLVLALDGEGGWSIHRGARAQSEGGQPELLDSGGSGPADQEGEEGSSEARARGGDAAANLQGMRMILSSASGQGRALEDTGSAREKVVARAPPYDAVRHRVVSSLHEAGDLGPGSSRGGYKVRPGPTALARPHNRAPVHYNAPLGGLYLTVAVKETEVVAQEVQPSRLTVWQRWSAVGRQLVERDMKGQVIQVGMIAGVVFMRTLLQDRIASLNGRTVQHVMRQDRSAFVRLIGLSVLQSGASAVLAPTLRHVADALALTWRKRLTAAAHARYLKGNTFYTVAQLAGMQDVDQRVTRDIERLCIDLAELIPTMVKPVVDITWFTFRLYKLTGRRGMAILYLYSFIGFAILRAVTPDFGALSGKEYFLEGAFRNIHTRVRTHAESIAFFGGGAREGQTVAAQYDSLMGHLRRVVNIRWPYAVADDFFTKQLPFNVTWGLTLLYAMDHQSNFSDPAVQGLLVHNMRYLSSVVSNCFTAFGELLALNKRFAELSGGVTRVSELLEIMDKSQNLQRSASLHRARSSSVSEGILFEAVNVVTPNGKMLARELSFQVLPGNSVLVTGPNGSGKSSLFRILAGLWPTSDGLVRRPVHQQDGKEMSDIFYVPQKPYTTIGTLLEQVIYPVSVADAVAVEGCEGVKEGRRQLEGRLDDLMRVVRLSYLVKREGGWNSVADWGETLSLGEQQRIGMARLFYQHPKFGVLDECTNATSVDIEEQLYRHAAKLGITLVTITQRPALVKYHVAELCLVDGQGEWEWRRIRK